MEFINFKQRTEQRTEALQRNISNVLNVINSIIREFPDFQPMRSIAQLLVDQHERTDELKAIDFDDRPPKLLSLEENSFSVLMVESLRQLSNLRQAILESAS